MPSKGSRRGKGLLPPPTIPPTAPSFGKPGPRAPDFEILVHHRSGKQLHPGRVRTWSMQRALTQVGVLGAPPVGIVRLTVECTPSPTLRALLPLSLPDHLIVLRDGLPIFRGPIVGSTMAGPSVTFYAEEEEPVKEYEIPDDKEQAARIREMIASLENEDDE